MIKNDDEKSGQFSVHFLMMKNNDDEKRLRFCGILLLVKTGQLSSLLLREATDFRPG